MLKNEVGAAPDSSTAKAEQRTAGDIDFPVIPSIVVPEIVDIGPAQVALELSMQSIIDPNAKGCGESQPVVPDELDGQDNPVGRQLNRRVEIFVRT